jgi:hypothetical protein
MVRLLVPAQYPFAEVGFDAHDGPAIAQVPKHQLVTQLSA